MDRRSLYPFTSELFSKILLKCDLQLLFGLHIWSVGELLHSSRALPLLSGNKDCKSPVRTVLVTVNFRTCHSYYCLYWLNGYRGMYICMFVCMYLYVYVGVGS
jgi:hypothetical protein